MVIVSSTVLPCLRPDIYPYHPAHIFSNAALIMSCAFIFITEYIFILNTIHLFLLMPIKRIQCICINLHNHT